MTQNENTQRILVVDDEEDICEIIEFNLRKAGYDVTSVLSVEEAVSLKPSENFDLILLDIMLGGVSGLSFAKVMREDYKSNIPIIFVTALDTEEDILKGFKTGGDDYISKPFSVSELVARVGAVLNRYKVASNISNIEEQLKLKWQKVDKEFSSAGEHSAEGGRYDGKYGGELIPKSKKKEKERIQIDGLKLYIKEHRVFVDDEEVTLTPKEIDILILLCKNPNRYYSRKEILKHVWKKENFVIHRTVDVHIARIRKKLGRMSELIKNRSGYGYMVNQDDIPPKSS
ncbi:MAG: response regulator transcription factor [Bacteroidales bacterium]|nr:response regulator transcription factor [Bacteroidales bacterium]